MAFALLLLEACATTAPIEKPVERAAPVAAPVEKSEDLAALIDAAPRTDGHEQTLTLTDLAHRAETEWRYDLAAKLYEELVTRAEKEGDQRVLAERVFDLARIHRIVGLYDRARREAARAEKLFGPNAKELGGVLQIEAWCEVMIDGDFAKAEGFARRALELTETNGTTLEVASALNNLAAFARFTGKYVEAERRYREALSRYEDADALDTVGAATTLHNLAGLLFSRIGSSPEVSGLEERAEVAATKALGPSHPFTIEILESLSNIYKQQRRGLRSIEAHERATRARGSKPSWCVNALGSEGCFAACGPSNHCADGKQCANLGELPACLTTCVKIGSTEGCAPGLVCSPMHRGELSKTDGVCAPQ
ncbi:MAG: tetratricopeptide repeat protein [Archangium sp.]